MNHLLVRNARIHTLAGPAPAEAMLVQGQRIRAVGAAAALEPLSGPGARVIDAQGAVIVPGFIDTHVHLAVTGLGLLALDLAGVDTLEGALERITRAAAGRPAGALVLGLNFQPELNREQRFPTPAELDRAAGGRPAYVMDRTGHQSLVNRAALALLDLPAGTPGVGQDEKGAFNGILADQANSRAFTLFWARFGAEMGLERAFDLAARAAVRGGITTLHALDDLETVRCLLACQGRLPLRVIPYTQTHDVAAVRALGLRQIGGCGAVMVDGDFTPHTAALLEPYSDRPETRGTLYYSDAELEEYVGAAHAAGMQVALHCVGSAAIEQLLGVYERVLARCPRPDHRHRIEHFELPAPGQAARARRLGVCLALQPAFNHYWPHHGEYPAVVGEARALAVDPLASLAAEGLALGLGSDSPVTPLRPLLWLHSAVNHSNPQERIAPGPALRLATQGGSYLGFEESDKGTLEPGKLADFVLLDGDPLDVLPAQIKDIRVRMTVVGGQVVYDAQEEATQGVATQGVGG